MALAQVKKNQSSISPQVLLKRQGLLESIADLSLTNSMDEYQWLKKHCQVIKSGVFFAAQLGKLENLGNTDERVRKDKKRSILNQALMAATSLQEALDCVMTMRENNKAIQDEYDTISAAMGSGVEARL